MLKCPIWGTAAEVRNGNGDYLVVNSPRAGGLYRISGSAVEDMSSLSPEQRAKLTWWLVDQRRQGERAPMVTTNILEHARVMPTPTILERRDRVLEFLGSRSPTLSKGVGIAGQMTEEKYDNRNALLAVAGSQADDDVFRLLEFLRRGHFIEGTDVVHITFEGWKYLEEQRAKQIASVQAFVAMWFDPSMAEAYTRGFERAILDAGYEPMRIDRKEHINKIDDEIVAEIRRSRFLIADFTSEPDCPRGGVYFEAGFAFGLQIPVIWTCREDLISHVHFDTRQFNHIVWSTPDDLYGKLKNRIGAVIGDGPLRKVH